MKLNEPELKSALEKFDKLLIDLPDENKSAPLFKNFITSFLRTQTKTITLPISDVMAVLKQSKPVVFSIIRTTYADNMALNIVTNINADYDKSIRRLNEIREQLGVGVIDYDSTSF
ncbi:hypothetical protein GN156_03935 [bacterium LRH843]|nr:hypothetical protein [bacterium LRH843]